MANETIARALTDILHLNRTSVKGYQEAAEEVRSPELKSQLTHYSQQRAGFVSDLEGFARQYGLQAQDNTIESVATDAAAAVHRGWIDLKAAITGQSDAAVLGAAETGEAAALKAYETVLAADIPTGAKSVFQQQHDAIMQAKNWLTTNKG